MAAGVRDTINTEIQMKRLGLKGFDKPIYANLTDDFDFCNEDGDSISVKWDKVGEGRVVDLNAVEYFSENYGHHVISLSFYVEFLDGAIQINMSHMPFGKGIEYSIDGDPNVIPLGMGEKVWDTVHIGGLTSDDVSTEDNKQERS